MKKAKTFKFPKEILEKLNECSNGYFLAVINEDGEFEIHYHYDNSLQELGMLNFLDIQCGSNMAYIREKILNQALEDDNENGEDGDKSSTD